MADKQESWFQAFALNVLLVASICTVGVAGYTIYNLNGTRSDIDKTILSIQKAVYKANYLLDQVNSVEFNSGLLDKLGTVVTAYEHNDNATVSALLDKIREFVGANPSSRISNRVQGSLSVFVCSGQLSGYHNLEELLNAVLVSLNNCTKGSAAELVFESRNLLRSVNGLTPEARALLQNFNGVLPRVTAVLQDMHRSGVIHKIGNAVDGVSTAVSVLNNDLNGFGVDFFGKVLATVKKLKKYADDHPSDKSITNKDRDLLKNMVTVYLPNVEECLASPPGMTKEQYTKYLGLSGKDFDSLSVLAEFTCESVDNTSDYERLMAELREYSAGLSSHIICSDGNFWFNLSDIVERVNQNGALSALLGGSGAGSNSGYGLGFVVPFISIVFTLLKMWM